MIRVQCQHLCPGNGYGRTNLFSKLKAVTGQTPNDFILTIRLKRAIMLRSNLNWILRKSLTEQVSLPLDISVNVSKMYTMLARWAIEKEKAKMRNKGRGEIWEGEVLLCSMIAQPTSPLKSLLLYYVLFLPIIRTSLAYILPYLGYLCIY